MAGLSIVRRRKAWLRGVACGASAKGKCRLTVPKLREIFQKGLLYGQANAQSAAVQAIVQQVFPRRREGVRSRRRRGERDGGRGGFRTRLPNRGPQW
jgi:hypothetical protein